MSASLRSRLRRVPAWLADAGLAAAVAATEVIGQLIIRPEDLPTGPPAFTGPSLLSIVIALLMSVPIVWRRRAPELTMAVIGLTAVGAVPLGVFYVGLGLLVALYSVAAYCERRTSFVLLGVFMFFAVVAHMLLGELRWALVNAFVYAGAWGLGDRQKTRWAYTAELEAKSERLEREREQEGRLAVAEERSRIARELHDVVAHSVSVMVVQAAGARRVLDHEPQRAAEALEQVEQTGRESLTELRRILGVLRDDDAEPALVPQPRLHELPALVDRFRNAGLAVELDTVGGARPLPAAVQLSAFRIVQEALTNALRHAGPASVRVRLRYEEGALEVDVSDDGRGVAPGSGQNGDQGQGLVGMRERASLHGGRLRAGPRPGGGFRVTAWLPAEPVP